MLEKFSRVFLGSSDFFLRQGVLNNQEAIFLGLQHCVGERVSQRAKFPEEINFFRNYGILSIFPNLL